MATKTLQELQAEQATIDGRYSIAAKNWADGEFDPEGVVTVLERAEEAELNAANSASVAYAAAGRASTAETNAGNAEDAAVAAKDAAVTASGTAVEAKDAAVAAQSAAETASSEAVDKVEGAAQVSENNTFSETNTFNGVSVFNGDSLFASGTDGTGSLTYKDQDMSHLLTYPIIAQLSDAGINPVSAFARTWAEWKALNPNWKDLPELIFYAPLMTADKKVMDGEASGDAPSTSCKFISSASTYNTASAYLLRQYLQFYTLKQGVSKDVYNCYLMKKCDFYAPLVTTFDQAMNAVGYLNTTNTPKLDLHIFAPELTTIVDKQPSGESYGINTSFYRIGLLNSFSIVAPKLVSSFVFSLDTGKKDEATNNPLGQNCEILQNLIAGIGTPDTLQTIATLPPRNGDDIVEGEARTKFEKLKAEAAAKNWKFISKNGTDL